MDIDKLNDYIGRCKKEAEEASRDRRLKWDELWGLYQNYQDYSTKMSWQSRCFLPKVYMVVNQAAAMVKRAILATDRLFRIEPKDKNDAEAQGIKDDIEKEFKRALRDSNFINIYSTMAKSAFLLGLGVPKVLWNDGLFYANANVNDIYIDPTYEPYQSVQPKYIIEESTMDLTVFKNMTREINKRAGRQIYKTSEIRKVEEDVVSQDKEALKRKQRGYMEYSKVTKKVRLETFWGDIIDDEKETITRNQIIQRANEKFIVRHQDNPFLHGKHPYVLTFPLVYPHRGIAGESLVEAVVSMQYAYNNIINMYIDNLHWTVNKMFEVQPTNLCDPRNITNIFPGKIITKHTPDRAIEEVVVGNVGLDAFNALSFLNTEMEKGTAVTEFIMGISGKNKTATEAELKTAQAQNLFDIIARDIEANSLAPLLEMSFKLSCQYGDIGEQWIDRFVFRVGGLSLIMAQRKQKEELGETFMMAMKFPSFGKFVNIKEAARNWLDLYGQTDLFVEGEEMEQPRPEQADAIYRQAGEDAKRTVQRLEPQQILRLAGALPRTG